MKSFRVKILSLAFILGSSLGYAPFLAAQENDDNDDGELACLNDVKSEHDDNVEAFIACVKKAIAENSDDDSETDVVERECSDEYMASVVKIEEVADCIDKID